MGSVMREYKGTRDDGEAEVEVRSVPGKGREIIPGAWRELDPRNKVANHSPDGFEWGYTGSGPAQLSLAMLCDHFEHGFDVELGKEIARMYGRPVGEGLDDHRWKEPVQIATRIYQDFKFKVVSSLDTDGWELDSNDVSKALQEIHGALKAGRRGAVRA